MVPEKPSPAKQWIVTTSGDQPLEQVAKELARAGFVVRDVLEEIGTITGSAAPDVVARLRKTRGVADVAPDTEVDVGPPDEDVTW
jgi:hypothetical protein